MKKLLFLFTALLCIVTVQAQQLNIGAAGVEEIFHDTQTDPNDGATVCVGTVGNGAETDCYLVKLNAARQIVWQRSIPNIGTDALVRVRVCANGDYIAAGWFWQNGRRRGLICRINSVDGSIIWVTTTAPLASANGDVFYDLIELANRNIAATGTHNLAPGTANGMVALFSPTGSEITKRISNYYTSDEFCSIAQLQSGDLVVAGLYWVGYNAAVMFELDPNTLAVNAQFGYRINLSVPGVNTMLNTLSPSKSHVVKSNVMLQMYGNTGGGTGTNVQFVYTYTPGTGNLTGNYFYHGSGGDAFTFYPLATNDYIITQTSSANGNFVSRITNGATLYDRQITNNTNSHIFCSNVSGANLTLAGITPGNDAYAFFSNVNFPASGEPCPVKDIDQLVNVANTPDRLTPNIALNINTTRCMYLDPFPIDHKDKVTIICNPCPQAQELALMQERLQKLEQELKESQAMNTRLQVQLKPMDILLSSPNTIILNQNVPNPFAESTTIMYNIPAGFRKAQMVFSTMAGSIIKTVDITVPGKGQLNVYGRDISSGVYTYTLYIDGRRVDQKQMVKQ